MVASRLSVSNESNCSNEVNEFIEANRLFGGGVEDTPLHTPLPMSAFVASDIRWRVDP